MFILQMKGGKNINDTLDYYKSHSRYYSISELSEMHNSKVVHSLRSRAFTTNPRLFTTDSSLLFGSEKERKQCCSFVPSPEYRVFDCILGLRPFVPSFLPSFLQAECYSSPFLLFSFNEVSPFLLPSLSLISLISYLISQLSSLILISHSYTHSSLVSHLITLSLFVYLSWYRSLNTLI